MFLTRQEVEELTARVRRDAQVRALRAMGIEHRVRPDGSVAVLRSHVEQQFAAPAPSPRAKKQVEPNWGAI